MALKHSPQSSPVRYDLNANTIPRTCTAGMGLSLPTISALAPSNLKKSINEETSQTVVSTSQDGNRSQVNTHYLLPCSSPMNIAPHSGPILSNSSASSASPPLELSSQCQMTSVSECQTSLASIPSVGLPPLINSFNKCLQSQMGTTNVTDVTINSLNPLSQNELNVARDYTANGSSLMINSGAHVSNSDSIFHTSINGLSTLADANQNSTIGIPGPGNLGYLSSGLPHNAFPVTSMSPGHLLNSVSNGQFCQGSNNNQMSGSFASNQSVVPPIPIPPVPGVNGNQADAVFSSGSNQFNSSGLLPLAGSLLDGSSMNLYPQNLDGISVAVSSSLFNTINNSNAKNKRRKQQPSPDSMENGKKGRQRHTSTVLAAQALIDGSYGDTKMDEIKQSPSNHKGKAVKAKGFSKVSENEPSIVLNGSQMNMIKKEEPLMHSDSDSEESAKLMSSLPPNADASLIRLERKRARNRVAARRCRERKVSLIQSLESEVNQLKQTIDRLRTNISQYSSVFNSSVDHLSRIADTIPELREELSRVPIMSNNLTEDVNL